MKDIVQEKKIALDMIFQAFNSETMSKEDFDSWVKSLIKSMYAYQIAKFTPQKK